MPELPEVESVRRLLERFLVGQRLVSVVLEDDPIVFVDPEATRVLLDGGVVESVGRRGKTFWVELASRGCVGMHLGMSGWVRLVDDESRRLVSHGKADLTDQEGKPRHLKLLLVPESGPAVCFTDGRRFARIWPSGGPGKDPKIDSLGPDAWLSPPSLESLKGLFAKKQTPLKAALLDQKHFAGVGNWIADEVAFQARLYPGRLCSSLSDVEIGRLLTCMKAVLDLAVEVDADASCFPDDWMFSKRWGGRHGPQEILGHRIARETIAGRTTAWVPDLVSP